MNMRLFSLLRLFAFAFSSMSDALVSRLFGWPRWLTYPPKAGLPVPQSARAVPASRLAFNRRSALRVAR